MKLLSKYNRVNVVATVVVLLLSAFFYYFFIRTVVVHQLDKDLKVEESEIKDFIKENGKLPEPTNYKDEQEEFMPAGNEAVKRNFSSVDIYNKNHDEYFTYRQLEFAASAAGKNYKLQVRKSQVETDDLIELILKITLGMVLILLATLFLINRFVLNKLWRPFNSTLQQLKQFNLSSRNNISLEQSKITEFTELNNAVTIMTDRVSKDYDEIKNFTENASHEIQTPLAIIKSKLELLSQDEGLKEDQMNTLQSVYEATNRLSKLNQSLILLTKIDNRQFGENESIDITDLIEKHLANYEELISAKLITVTKNIDSDVKNLMNEALAEILISNLITNAIKHNIDKGFIKITLTRNELVLSNSGAALTIPPEELFERFKKDKVTSESLGLGLSIVKKICERCGYRIEYNYFDLVHTTTINF
jgi:signal transduction histidine kinase